MSESGEYRYIVDSFEKEILAVPEDAVSVRTSPGSWTLKEIIGHLIDSASNNHQRFVRLQQGNLSSFPGYDQEQWIRIQDYDSCDWNELVSMWKSYNRLILHIIGCMDVPAFANIWENGDKRLRLDFLVEDYFSHMKWHINQFEERLAEIIPPC
jgi:hypothetical protein